MQRYEKSYAANFGMGKIPRIYPLQKVLRISVCIFQKDWDKMGKGIEFWGHRNECGTLQGILPSHQRKMNHTAGAVDNRFVQFLNTGK